ncbi:MAG: BlaI/MecI/CopY family transcriptional regulator [Pirellulaceae bacterium]
MRRRNQHGTVQRLLQSLEDKGFVARDGSLGVNLFSARVGREAYGGDQLETLAQALTGGSIAPLLTHLLDQKKLSKEEIKRLRDLLNEETASMVDYLFQAALSNASSVPP